MPDKKDTAEYSSTKAPETRKEAEEKAPAKDWRLLPGGATGSPSQQGMAALDRSTVPSEARELEQTSYGDTRTPETT